MDGKFKPWSESYFYNRFLLLQIDSMEKHSDSFMNNQGERTSKKNDKKLNW